MIILGMVSTALIVFLAIFSLLLLTFIIFFAISPKSSKTLRGAAIIALGAILLSLIVCAIVIMAGPAEDPQRIPLPPQVDSSSQAESPRRASDIIILLIFILGLSLVIIKATHDQKKANQKAMEASKAQKRSQKLEELDHHGTEDLNPPEDDEHDDGFDLDI